MKEVNLKNLYTSQKQPSSFTEITLRYGCSPVNLLYIFRTPFLRIPLNGCCRLQLALESKLWHKKTEMKNVKVANGGIYQNL